MADKKTQRETDEQLDLLGRAVMRAAASNDEAADAAASSPFLYTRLRTRIEAERERREAGESWLALLGVVWRSAPAMALVAVFAFVLFWSANPPPASIFTDEALLGAPDTGIEHVVFADRSSLSSDEVLATIIDEDEWEASR